MTRVKICGITNIDDACNAAAFGADALGFNFYAKSSRYIKPQTATEIIKTLPSKVDVWGVFVNATVKEIQAIVKKCGIDNVQLHGEEDPKFIDDLKIALPVIEVVKAFRISDKFMLSDVLTYEVNSILLDAFSPLEHGGTGEPFDWKIAIKIKTLFPQLFLAGGLSVENITNALQTVSPFGVDVCSGIELEKGIKDTSKMERFITLIKDHDVRTK